MTIDLFYMFSIFNSFRREDIPLDGEFTKQVQVRAVHQATCTQVGVVVGTRLSTQLVIP
jgi:hypothetical protein